MHCAGLLGGELHGLAGICCASGSEEQLGVQPLGLSSGQQRVLSTHIAHSGEAAQLQEKNQENELLNSFGEEDSSSFCNKIPHIQNYQ